MTKLIKPLGLVLFLVTASVILFTQLPANMPTDPEQKLEIFSDKEGKAALSVGNCSQDSECKPTGCSSQICANHEVVTTCELGIFPDKETYNCGCKENKCVWYRYK